MPRASASFFASPDQRVPSGRHEGSTAWRRRAASRSSSGLRTAERTPRRAPPPVVTAPSPDARPCCPRITLPRHAGCTPHRRTGIRWLDSEQGLDGRRFPEACDDRARRLDTPSPQPRMTELWAIDYRRLRSSLAGRTAPMPSLISADVSIWRFAVRREGEYEAEGRVAPIGRETRWVEGRRRNCRSM